MNPAIIAVVFGGLFLGLGVIGLWADGAKAKPKPKPKVGDVWAHGTEALDGKPVVWLDLVTETTGGEVVRESFWMPVDSIKWFRGSLSSRQMSTDVFLSGEGKTRIFTVPQE